MKKEQETKKDYESPLTKETQVEMEGSLCGSANLQVDSPNGIDVSAQEVNTDFNEQNKFGDSSNWE